MSFEISANDGQRPNWGKREGTRELLQNGEDGKTAGYPLTIRYADGALEITNDGVVLDRAVWLYGFSTKRGDDRMIGRHGTGFTDGIIALCREGVSVVVDNGSERWTPYLGESDNFTGQRTLQVKVRKLRVDRPDRVVVRVGITWEEWVEYRKLFLSITRPRDMETVEDYGSIIRDPSYKGQIFVKGVFVCQQEDLAYGYDLHTIETNSDREVVSHWQLNSAIAELVRRLADKYMEEDNLQQIDQLAEMVYQTIESGSEDAKNLGNELKWNPNGLLGSLKDLFTRKHGAKAVPVVSEEEANKVSFYGLRGIVVPRSLQQILSNKGGFGPLEDTIRNAINVSGDFVADMDLTAPERRNFRAALRLCYLAGIGDLDELEKRVRVYQWTAPDAPRGLWGGEYVNGKAGIRIARGELKGPMTVCLGTIIHELAHDHGGDGTLAHRSAEETMWEKVAELLVAEAGIGWLAD